MLPLVLYCYPSLTPYQTIRQMLHIIFTLPRLQWLLYLPYSLLNLPLLRYVIFCLPYLLENVAPQIHRQKYNPGAKRTDNWGEFCCLYFLQVDTCILLGGQIQHRWHHRGTLRCLADLVSVFDVAKGLPTPWHDEWSLAKPSATSKSLRQFW